MSRQACRRLEKKEGGNSECGSGNAEIRKKREGGRVRRWEGEKVKRKTGRSDED
jgi:hypothetical protein